MTNTISMLTIFVTVLMTNCQVSLQWKIGPVTSQTKVIKQMATNAELEPASFAVFCAMLANPCFLVIVILPAGGGSHAPGCVSSPQVTQCALRGRSLFALGSAPRRRPSKL